MSRPHPTPIGHNVEIANVWLGEIAKKLRLNRHGAWTVLRAVLHALRNRLSPEQIAHLGNQLPLIVRGVLYDQWRPGRKAKKLHTEAEFLGVVDDQLPDSTPIDPRLATRAVFAILRRHPTSAIHKILRTLPPQIRALGSEEAVADESSLAWE